MWEPEKLLVIQQSSGSPNNIGTTMSGMLFNKKALQMSDRVLAPFWVGLLSIGAGIVLVSSTLSETIENPLFWLAVVVVISLPFLPLIVVKPHIVALLVVAVVPFETIAKIGEVSLLMITGILMFILWLLYLFVSHKPIALPPFAFPLFTYVGVAILSVLVKDLFSYASWRMALTYISLLGLTIIFYNVFDSVAKLTTMLYMLSFSLTLYICISLALFLSSSPLYEELTLGSRRLDLLGTGANINVTGQAILALLPVQIPLYINARKPLRLLVVFSVVIWLISLIFLESRTVVMAALATGAIYLLNIRKQSLQFDRPALLVVLLLLAAFLPTFNSEFAERLIHPYTTRPIYWTMAIKMFLDNPLFGVGAGQFGQALANNLPVEAIALIVSRTDLNYFLKNTAAHNMILNVLAETGLTGLLTFSFFLICSFLVGIRALKSSPTPESFFLRSLLWHLLVGAFGFVVASMLLSGERTHLLYILLTAIAITTRFIDKAAKELLTGARARGEG